MNTALRFLAAAATSSLLLLSTGCSSSDETNSEAAGHITRAETYADQGQYRSAMLEVRNAVQKDPGNVDHVLVLAGIYNSIGAGEQATDLLESWQEDHADLVALPLARGYILQGKHLSAREALEGYEPQGDSATREYEYLKAESQNLAGNTDQALGQLRSLQQAHPADAEIAAGLGRTLLASGEANAAVNALTQWTEQNGDNAEILYLTGLAHYRMGNVEESTQVLTDATAVVPTSDIFLPVRRNILTLLSRSLTEQGRITEAQVYNKILAENTSSDTLQRAESALEAIQRGDLSSARTTLEELLQQNPENEQVALMLGTLNLQEGRVEDAETLLTGNIDAETTPTPFIRAATITQLDGGKREEALRTLARAIEARPKDTDLLAMHGILALSLPEHQESGVHSLSKALDIDPSRSRLRLGLAQHYMSKGQQEQALAQMRMAFTETPTDWTVTQNYIRLLFQTDKESEADEVAESLLNGFSDSPRAVTLAALTKHRLGETAAARSRLEQQLEENPEDLPSLTAMASIHHSDQEFGEAAETLLKAAVLQPDNFSILRAAGRAYARNHRPDEIVEWLTGVATEHDKLATPAKILAANVRIQQGKLADARKLLDALPEQSHPEQLQAVRTSLLVAEAQKAVREQDWSTARARAGEVSAMQPDKLEAVLMPAQVAIAEGKYEEALESLEELEEAHGANPALDLTRARLFAVRDGGKEALDYLDKRWSDSGNSSLLPVMINLARQHSPSEMDRLTGAWVNAQPESVAANSRRAEYLMSEGNNEGAISHYETVIRLQPENTTALNNLAWLLREKDLEQGLRLAERAAQLAPENGAVQDTYGWLLHLDGQNSAALATLEKALALAPESKEISEHLEAVRQAL